MTNLQAYEALTEANYQWGRIDANTIYVWVTGYKTQDSYDLETFLRQAKMRCMSHDFDERCGKTKSVFKHKE